MLNPLLLLFLPLALVPVLLHLITRHRLTTVELSTFRFLMDSYVQQRRRIQLLEFLVMLLRLAFLVLIIMTLARPVVRGLGFLGSGGAGRDVAIVVDASPSMAVRSGGTTSLQRAAAAAETIVGMLGAQDHVKVVAAGAAPEVLAEGFAGDADRIVGRLRDLAPDTGTADLPAALAEVFAGDAHGSRVIYLLSDLRRGPWSALADDPVLEKFTDEVQTVVMDLGPSEPVRNVAVVGDPPLTARAVKGLPVLLSATVVNSSPERAVDTVLSVLLDDELVTQVNLSLQPGERVTRPLSVTPTRAGAIRGRFEVPADAFPDDDAFLFCLNASERLHVLLATGPAGEVRTERPALYLKAALTSPRRAGAAVAEADRQLAEAIAVTAVRADALTPAMLAAAEAVILADVPLDAPRGKMLRAYVEAGGGLLVLPGPHVAPEAYAAHLLADGKAAAPVTLGGARGDVDDEEAFQPVAGLNLGHPVLSAFADPQHDYFTTVRLYRYFPLQVPAPPAAADSVAAPADEAGAKDAAAPKKTGAKKKTATAPQNVAGHAEPLLPPARAPRARVLMRLPDGTPVLVEASIGEGRLLVAGFAATPNWSNLPLKPEFVPILLRAVAYLQKASGAANPAAVAPSQPAVLRLTGAWADAQVQCTDPTGKPHAIDLHRDGPRLVGAMLETGRKGFYTFEVLPRTDGAPERVRRGFAVNLADRQADFTTLDEDGVRDLLAPAEELQYVHGSPDDPLLSKQLTHKHEIWRLLIWVTFLVIGVEFLMATLGPKGRTPGEVPVTGLARLKRWGGALARTVGLSQDWNARPGEDRAKGEERTAQQPAPFGKDHA